MESTRLEPASAAHAHGLAAAAPAANTPPRAALWLVGAALVLPFLLIPFPPLTDYPNHLARLYVIAYYEEVPLFGRLMESDVRLLPNLGIEMLGLPWLGLVRDPLIASRLILASMAVLFIFGAHALGRAILDRASWRAIAAGSLLYNSSFLAGFASYMIGVGLFLITFAFWYRLRRAWTPQYLGGCTILVGMCYLAHLSTVAFFGLAAGAVLLTDLLREGWRNPASWLSRVREAMPFFVLPVLLVLFPAPPGAGPTIWNSIFGKLLLLAGPVRTYSVRVDLLLIITATLLAAVVASRARAIRLRWPIALASVALLLGAAVTPKVAFGSYAADARYIVPAFCLMLFAVDAEVRGRAALGLTLVALAVVRLGVILATWLPLSRETATTVAMFDAIPPQSTVLVAFYSGPTDDPTRVDEVKHHAAFTHVASWSTLTRQDLSSNMFPYPFQLARFRDPSLSSLDGGLAWNTSRLAPRYDYVFSYNPTREVVDILSPQWEPVREFGSAALWRRRPGR